MNTTVNGEPQPVSGDGQAAHAAACRHHGMSDKKTAAAWAQRGARDQAYFAAIEQGVLTAAAPGGTLTAAERTDAIGQLGEQLAELQELLHEVGVLAANAPEDDAFSVCEEIAMRIAAHGIPVEGK